MRCLNVPFGIYKLEAMHRQPESFHYYGEHLLQKFD
jgi:hypothetical protein